MRWFYSYVISSDEFFILTLNSSQFPVRKNIRHVTDHAEIKENRESFLQIKHYFFCSISKYRLQGQDHSNPSSATCTSALQ